MSAFQKVWPDAFKAALLRALVDDDLTPAKVIDRIESGAIPRPEGITRNPPITTLQTWKTLERRRRRGHDVAPQLRGGSKTDAVDSAFRRGLSVLVKRLEHVERKAGAKDFDSLELVRLLDAMGKAATIAKMFEGPTPSPVKPPKPDQPDTSQSFFDQLAAGESERRRKAKPRTDSQGTPPPTTEDGEGTNPDLRTREAMNEPTKEPETNGSAGGHVPAARVGSELPADVPSIPGPERV